MYFFYFPGVHKNAWYERQTETRPLRTLLHKQTWEIVGYFGKRGGTLLIFNKPNLNDFGTTTKCNFHLFSSLECFKWSSTDTNNDNYCDGDKAIAVIPAVKYNKRYHHRYRRWANIRDMLLKCCDWLVTTMNSVPFAINTTLWLGVVVIEITEFQWINLIASNSIYGGIMHFILNIHPED